MAKAAGAASPGEKLDGFLARYDPEIAKRAKAILKAMRKRMPGAVELVYDNYNALAIGFARGERLADVVFSIAVYPRWVSLFFAEGAALHDPKKLLKGSGNRMRHIVLGGPEALADPGVAALMDAALKRAPTGSAGKGRIVIKSVSAKQRPRRP